MTADLHIDSVGARGDGLALASDQRIYIPYTAPGDVVRVAYSAERGAVEAVLTPSPHRTEAPCRHYGKCGGCAMQHVNADFYQRWKRDIVVQALTHAGFDAGIVQPLVACPPESRRRAQFSVCKTAQGLVFGFNQRGSSRIIHLDACLVLAPELAGALPDMRALAAATPERWRNFDVMATLCNNGVDVSLIGGAALGELTGPERLVLTDIARKAGVLRVSVDADLIAQFEAPVVRFGAIAVAVPPGGFLQPSREGEAALTGLVRDHIAGAARIADLFSGCGTFSLPLAAGAQVDAFDADTNAIAALDGAARQAALQYPLNAQLRNLYDRPLSAAELKVYDAAVFDPPRAGARMQAEQLAQSCLPTVIGVSCNPASFARDAELLRAGGYVLSQVFPVDQFVYAAHVELVGVFQKG